MQDSARIIVMLYEDLCGLKFFTSAPVFLVLWISVTGQDRPCSTSHVGLGKTIN